MLKSTKIVISLVLQFILIQTYINGQLEAGLKIGISNIEYANPRIDSILFSTSGTPEFSISPEQINFGYHVGLYSRLLIWKIYLQPEILINSSSINYKIRDFSNPDSLLRRKEQYTTIDIPIILGLKMKWFNIHGGISGHLPIFHVSEIKDVIPDYKYDVTNFTYSYLAGIGFDFWRFRTDIRYELSTSFFGEHINYKGTSYHFPNKNNRILVGLAYKF